MKPVAAFPDLLNVEPRARGQISALSTALAFAFTTGGTQDAFDRVVADAHLAETTWQRDCFAADLFLDDLVGRCLAVPRPGQSKPPDPKQRLNLLCQPAPDLAGVHFRQEILAELADDAGKRAALMATHKQLGQWRRLLDSSTIGQRLDPTRRRLDILIATKEIVDALAERFEDARSGLSRLASWAQNVQSRTGYQHLRELIEHEGHIATIDVSLRLGHDGEIRSFEIVRVTETRGNPLWIAPIRRFLAAVAAFLGGYRIRRAEVLSRIIDGVFDELQADVALFFGLAADLEFYLGALHLKELAEERGLSVCLPEFTEGPTDSGRRVQQLFNPFLLFEETAPVPCDLETRSRSSIVIVTGPNSGGKTRLIQAVALAQLLAQSGLFVPAKRAILPWTSGLFASLSTAPTADQREGRLGTELLRIRRLFEQVQLGSLVVLDELCSGTNPSEGEEIFELVLDLLDELGAQAFITTHFLQFASRLAAAPPLPCLEFLQVDLDPDEHPTYQFRNGVATTSLARQTARRLGVTREELSALIKEKKQVRRQQAASDADAEAAEADTRASNLAPGSAAG